MLYSGDKKVKENYFRTVQREGEEGSGDERETTNRWDVVQRIDKYVKGSAAIFVIVLNGDLFRSFHFRLKRLTVF